MKLMFAAAGEGIARSIGTITFVVLVVVVILYFAFKKKK